MTLDLFSYISVLINILYDMKIKICYKKHACLRKNREMLKNCGKQSNHPRLEYLLTGARKCSTPYNTDVQ